MNKKLGGVVALLIVTLAFAACSKKKDTINLGATTTKKGTSSQPKSPGVVVNDPAKTSPFANEEHSSVGPWTRAFVGNLTIDGNLKTELNRIFTEYYGTKGVDEHFSRFTQQTCAQIIQYRFDGESRFYYGIELQNAACPAEGIQRDESKIAIELRERLSAQAAPLFTYDLTDWNFEADSLPFYAGQYEYNSSTRAGRLLELCTGRFANDCQLQIQVGDDDLSWNALNF